jgi:hypothetical protein
MSSRRQQISIQERLSQELEDIGGDRFKDSGFEGEKPTAKPGSKARARGSLGIPAFKKLAKRIWKSQPKAS